MTTEELAQLALKTLNQQKAYFKSRGSADLSVAKALERQLRVACETILAPPGDSPHDLFSEFPEDM